VFHTWAPLYKTFYVRNLQKFVVSLGACPWDAFPDLSNVSEED